MAKTRRGTKRNAVAEAIEKVGGLTQATVLTGVATQTIVRWREKGVVKNAVAAFKLAKASGISAAELVGADDD